MITVAAVTPSLDLTYVLDQVQLGRIHRTSAALRVAGGKALNLARAAVALGAECSVTALLGGDTGRQVGQLLRADGIELTEIDSGVETRICVSLASAASGELTEVYQDPAPVAQAALDATLDSLNQDLPGRSGWLALAGRGTEGAQHIIGDLVQLGRMHGQRVAIDTHSEALVHAIDHQPDLVKINRAEAAQLLQRPIDSDLVHLAREMAARSGGWVVLTDGTEGTVSVRGETALRVLPLPVRGHFPVGSGDSFLGGLLAAVEAGADDETALRAAAGCATANAVVPGQARFDAGMAHRLARLAQVVSAE